MRPFLLLLFTFLFLLCTFLTFAVDESGIVKKFKYPNKPRPFYPIEGEYFQVAGIAVHPLTDEIFFCDMNQIFKISGDQQFLVAGAGGGPGHRDGHLLAAKFFKTHFHPNGTNSAIRMIKDGQVTTLAGQGSPIYNASRTTPLFVASSNSIITLGEEGLLLIADTINSCIIKAKIDRDDSMSLEVVAGDGSKGWLDGVGTKAMLNWPTDLAIHADRSIVFMADSKNRLIRSLDISTFEVKTVAGTGFVGNEIRSKLLLGSSFNEPQAVAIDPRTGIIYIADSGNNCIKMINGSAISLWAGSSTAGFKNGLSSSAMFAQPMGLAFDPSSETLYVADTFNHAVRRIDSKRLVSTVVGMNGTFGFVDGDAKLAMLNYPKKVVVGRSPGELLILDSGNHAIRVLDVDLKVSSIFVDPDANLQGVAVDSMRNIYVSDSKSILIIKKPEDTSSGPIDGDSQSSQLRMILVTILSGLSATLALILFVYVRAKRKQHDTSRILTRIGAKKMTLKGGERSQSVTVSPSKTVAIAIPGYLLVDLDKTVAFPATIQVSGKGGTAQVIKCKLKDPKLIEKHGIVDVAVKIFGQETSKESFLYEVMIMSSLPKSHNLIQLLGYSDDRRVSAIIMKDYPMSLQDLLVDKSFPNNSEFNLKVAIDIANGMNLIHQKSIVHFDLKPANVLAEVVNGQWNYAVCDFGFANLLSDVQDKIVKGVKKPTTMGITARYAAPELFAKVSNQADTVAAPVEIEKKIDVYAYAMTLFYVYAREAPWKDLSIDEIERFAIVGERPEIPAEIIPMKIEDLIKVCWSHDSSDRPGFDGILEILLNAI